MSSFTEFGLGEEVLKALEKMEYREPTAIQSVTIPQILAGYDIIALAQTGSGKTAACAIPISHKVNVGNNHIQALIIVPTRELALQYATETQKIGREKGVKAFGIYGGEDMHLQSSKLRAGVHVVVATPGRLIDFIYNRLIDLSHVETLILDEADEMLSMGFYDDLDFIINCLVHDHQTLLFSATMPVGIKKIAKGHMKDPIEITLTKEHASPKNLEHRFLYCRHQDRERHLIALLREFDPGQCLIFSQSREGCEALSRTLRKHFDQVDYLHAGLNQDTRSIITGKFRNAKIRYLVATDVAARGLDFTHVTHVFIYQLAPDPEVYVHRSGRAGRADRAGVSVALVTDREVLLVNKILKLIDRQVTWIGEPPPLKKPAHSRPPRSRSHQQRVHRPQK